MRIINDREHVERNRAIVAKIEAFTQMMSAHGPNACREYLQSIRAESGEI